MKSSLEKIYNFLLDVLFPTYCLSCKKEGAWICDICLSKIQLLDEHVCPLCEKHITPDGRTCLSCKKHSSLDGLITASSYHQSPVANAIHMYKYRFICDLHIPLASLLIKSLQKTEIPLPDIILPIPLHPRRLRWRGFNQAALLAKILSENLILPNEIPFHDTLLYRNRYTTSQKEISNYLSRKSNVAGAFSLKSNEQVQNKIILIVDDVVTTGSTIFECAKVLKQAGAKEVFAIAVARQSNK
jgi:ComF family protein